MMGEFFVFFFSGVTKFEVVIRFSVVCVDSEYAGDSFLMCNVEVLGFNIDVVLLADARSNITFETIDSRTPLSCDGNVFLSLST
jgi:hypothetical protein